MSLLTYPKFQAPDINGVNMAGGLVYTYITGTSTPKDTYSDEAKTVPNSNPVVLNARGEADIYLDGEYKIVLKTSADVEVWTVDSFTGNALTEDLASITDTTKGSFLVGVYRNVTGYVGRKLSSWIADRPFYVTDFGATGDGVTDDYAAIRAAYVAADGGKVMFPAGVFLMGTMLDMDGEGGTLEGNFGLSSTNARTEIKTSGAINAIRMSVTHNCHIRNMYINGSGAGLNGVVVYNAGRGSVRGVYVENFTLDGFLFDIDHTTPSGNNNIFKAYDCFSASNNRGYAVATTQSDNNGIEFHSCEASSNTAEGLLYKGENMRLFGGIYHANGTYGIQISESGDASNSVGSTMFSPWLENNTSGGYRGGGKSTRNILYYDQSLQGVSNAVGSTDMEMSANASNNTMLQWGTDVTKSQITVADAAMAWQTSSTEANVTLYIRPKGSGTLRLDDLGTGGVRIGPSGTSITKHLSATATYDPANMATDGSVTSTTITVTGAVAGDTCLASHSAIGANNVLVSAHVSAANTVTVVLMNKTGGALDIASGTLRADVWQH